MFSSPYDEEDATAQIHGVDEIEEAKPEKRGPCLLVPDSDNDDSLGLPPFPHGTQPAQPPRAFSKRAARCAGQLLHHSDASASAEQRARCTQQLRRLGGAYTALSQGQSPTLWLRYSDLNARVISETETYFEGQAKERLQTPHTSRANAPVKPAVRLSGTNTASARALCGVRAPLASSRRHEDAFTLSRGEQFALSLLSMEEGTDGDTTSHALPTYVLHRDDHGAIRRTSLPDATLGLARGVSAASSPHPSWVYEEAEEGQCSTHRSPSAAHTMESPGAAPASRKRSRTGEEDVATSSPRCSMSPSTLSTPRSLSATVIEEQNQRVQWHLLRHQSLFSPF